MNSEQRGSAAKYFYDLSKGCLLAGLVGLMTRQVGFDAFSLYGVLAAYSYSAAYYLEG